METSPTTKTAKNSYKGYTITKSRTTVLNRSRVITGERTIWTTSVRYANGRKVELEGYTMKGVKNLIDQAIASGHLA